MYKVFISKINTAQTCVCTFQKNKMLLVNSVYSKNINWTLLVNNRTKIIVCAENFFSMIGYIKRGLLTDG